MIRVEHREPHRERGRRIAAEHPAVRSLAGRSFATAFIGGTLVLLQLGAAWILGPLPWWAALLAAWCFGAFVAHALFAVIHEACHGLVFERRAQNRALMLLANVPFLAPFAIPLGHYHLVHHRTQGQLGRDPDLPSRLELALVGQSRLRRFFWHLAFPFAQLLRIGEKRDALGWSDRWLWANVVLQLLAAAALWWWLEPAGVLYLAASGYFVFALHPLTGRYVQEHYVLDSSLQETNSYYGWLNRLSLNFGHHVEHHDFPAVPWHRLPQIRALAPDHYAEGHRSWTVLWLRLLFDPRAGIDRRVVRPPD